MRLLANENVPGMVVEQLRAVNWDVSWIRTECPGIVDRDVLQRAVSENRILLTFDKDFGELAVRSGLKTPQGIILFRLGLQSPEMVAKMVLKILQSRTDWAGHFSVADEMRVRMRPLA